MSTDNEALPPLPEDEQERRIFDATAAELYGGDALAQVQTALIMWSRQAPPNGSYSKMLAIFANEVAYARAALAQRQQVPLTDEQIDGLRGLDTASRVRFYEHDFYVLSNFSAFTLQWKGLSFPTSEHAYHWEKFAPHYTSLRDYVQSAPSAHEAFKLAERNKHCRRTDWDDVKVGIMLDILREKAKQHEYVRRKLLATGDRELVEDSWRDDFWGWGPNRDGKNMLGTLWMQVRAELRELDQ